MKKRIVVCCDGTWNDLEMRYITNVGRLVQALPTVGSSNGQDIFQMVFYDDGVGSDSSGIRRLWQGGLGKGIDNLIYEAYRFISVNYEDGDEICMFGFSRGAFTVRSVAGMIGKVGLVPRKHLKKVPQALDFYRSKSAADQATFKKNYSVANPKITLLGCWDTVGSLGIPDKVPFLPIDDVLRRRYQFHDTKLGSHVERAIHAVAIDEVRKEFQATLMEKHAKNSTTKLIQKWFPGDHGCVGGGTWEKRGLSNRCLPWLLDQAAETGIDLKPDWNLLHDKAISDHSILVPNEMTFFYSKYNRPMPKELVNWDDIDVTARMRWVEHADYRPPVLRKRFAAELNALDQDLRQPLPELTELAVDESADVRVFAKDKHNGTNIKVTNGGKFIIEVSPVQVWQDGKFDPCDIRGWSTEDSNKPPYIDGEKANIGSIKGRLIRGFKKKRLHAASDWFELVMKIGDQPFQGLDIKKPKHEDEAFKIKFTAKASGELVFAANDLSSRNKLVDKYDNNEGWVWLKVTRLS